MMTRPLIDQAVDRFLGWKLPVDFSPDASDSNRPFSIPIPLRSNDDLD
jgi:hypothetical protein